MQYGIRKDIMINPPKTVIPNVKDNPSNNVFLSSNFITIDGFQNEDISIILVKITSGKNQFKDQSENHHLNNLQVYHYNDHIFPYKKQSNFLVLILENIDHNIQNQQFQLQYLLKQL